MRWLLLIAVFLIPQPSWAVTYYLSRTNACSAGSYSIVNDNCTGSDGTSYTSMSTAITAMVPGDVLYVRGGAHNQRLIVINKTSLTFESYPGESAILRPTTVINSYSVLFSGGSGHRVRNLEFDGTSWPNDGYGWRNEGSNDLVIENVYIHGFHYQGMLLQGGNGFTIRNSRIQSQVSTTCVPGTRWYGLYLHHGQNVVVEDNIISGNPGGGFQAYPGPLTNLTIRRNKSYGNGTCTTTPIGGGLVMTDSTGGAMTGVKIYDNLFYGNGPGGTGGSGGGLRVSAGTFSITGTLIFNNVFYNNQANGGTAYGLSLSGALLADTQVRNNIALSNETGQIINSGTTNTTLSNNLCLATDSCGTTGKVSVTAPGDVFVNAAGDDFRLKTGTNLARDAGITVSTRPAPVDAPDIGAYEQGKVVSAVVAGGFLEVTMNVMTPPVLPATGITGAAIANNSSTGTPVASAVSVKAGSDNQVLVTMSGFTGAGSCFFILNATNMTDSGYIGGTTAGTTQGVNTVALQDVTGTCNNTSGPASPGGPYSIFHLDDGSGTTANDATANNNDGTVSSGVTWGTGSLTIPTDATYRHIASTYGAGVNPTTQSFAKCVLVVPDTTHAQKVVFSAGGNGSSQRWYAGWATVSGQLQWGIGIQGSGFTTGSEFPVVAQQTLVCLTANSGTSTATLWVDRVKGTLSGKSVKTYTSYTLVGNLRTGNDGTFTVNNGGITVYEDYTWDSLPADADIEALYDSLFPTGGSVGGYAQVNSQQQGVYLTTAGAVENRGSPGGTIKVVAGGGAAVVFQVDCTGADCGPVALKSRYSRNGGAYNLTVPQDLGADGIAMWGENTSPGLNVAVVGDCISGALTENYGPTVTDAVALPTITLSQNHSYCLRYIFRFGADQAGVTFDLRLYQDNGQPLDGAYAVTPRVEVIAPQAGAGP